VDFSFVGNLTFGGTRLGFKSLVRTKPFTPLNWDGPFIFGRKRFFFILRVYRDSKQARFGNWGTFHFVGILTFDDTPFIQVTRSN
jgi:hypothetical protein